MIKRDSLVKSLILSCLLTSSALAQGSPEPGGSRFATDLEYFSYCSNGTCRLITGEFFQNARGMPVDLNVSCKKNNQYALTFDDGPSKNYPRLLEILRLNNVKATFFIVGSNLDNVDNIKWFRQAFADGHTMANHTFNHDDLTKMNEAAMVETIEKTRIAMINAIYPNPPGNNGDSGNRKRLEASSRFVRPPFGNIDMDVDRIFKKHEYISVRWNADRYDWNMPGNDPKTTWTILDRVRQQLNYISENVGKGVVFNQSVIDLNHDWQPTTVDAIQELISLVKSRGYEFVTLDECLGV